jgi:two-component system, LuxR family, sensor kinase FixL
VLQRRHRQRAEDKQRLQLAHLTRVAILGQLSGALAHELTQPLTAILSNAQAAQRFLSSDHVDLQGIRNILEDIVSDDKRAGDVIRRVRALLKRGETQLQRLDLPQVIRDVLVVAHTDLVVRQVEVSCRFAPALPAVQGDRVQIQQVLLNLLLNAAEAMIANGPHDRQIGISVAPEAAAVHVSIADCGTGIVPAQLENVFDPFFTTKSTGLGLGLAICRSIASAHGGRLWATNNTGRGSTFHFTLPAKAEAQRRLS